MSKVAIVGTGFIGRAWAISFARAGHDVALWDVKANAPAEAISYIEEVLPDLAANDLLDGRTPAAVRARINASATLEAALKDAEHIQENTLEDINVKREVTASLDGIAAPGTVIASSTSALLHHCSPRALPDGPAALSFIPSIRLMSSLQPRSFRLLGPIRLWFRALRSSCALAAMPQS
jgi:3-hydroxyacyl-CoA dehydrogenase